MERIHIEKLLFCNGRLLDLPHSVAFFENDLPQECTLADTVMSQMS